MENIRVIHESVIMSWRIARCAQLFEQVSNRCKTIRNDWILQLRNRVVIQGNILRQTHFSALL
jgi:hypothetical protein